MRAGTIARLINAVAVIAVIIIVAAPSLTTLAKISTEPLTVSTHAVYSLEYMDEKTLGDNLEDAVSGLSGCIVEFGDERLSVDSGNFREVAGKVKSSGASVATVTDSGGKVLVQSDISYGNAVLTGGRSGITSSGPLFKGISLDMTMCLFSPDGRVSITADSQDEDPAGEVSVEYIMPLVVYNIAAAYGCNAGVHVNADYTGMAVLDVTSKNNGDSISYASSVTKESGSTVVEVRGCMASEVGTGKIGNADVEFTYDGGFVMKLSCEGNLYDVLKESLADGRLTASLNGVSYTMGQEQTSGFIEAVKALEERA